MDEIIRILADYLSPAKTIEVSRKIEAVLKKRGAEKISRKQAEKISKKRQQIVEKISEMRRRGWPTGTAEALAKMQGVELRESELPEKSDPTVFTKFKFPFTMT